MGILQKFCQKGIHLSTQSFWYPDNFLYKRCNICGKVSRSPFKWVDKEEWIQESERNDKKKEQADVNRKRKNKKS